MQQALIENNALRNRIYSWPNVSTCAVDQDIVRAEDANYDIASRTASRKGLDALEYNCLMRTLITAAPSSAQNQQGGTIDQKPTEKKPVVPLPQSLQMIGDQCTTIS